MNALQRGDRLVVSELSRLGRSLGQIVTILDALAKAGVAFVAMKENIRIEGQRDIKTAHSPNSDASSRPSMCLTMSTMPRSAGASSFSSIGRNIATVSLGASATVAAAEKLGALGLMLNVIAFWNATYMQAVVENLQAQGHAIDPANLARVSPLAHRLINFLGRYAFTLPEAVARGQLRPLREPDSE